jgi:hypothetical protein
MIEYVEALAAPLAAIIGFWIAARLAVTGFREQKALELRLDWYRRMHLALSHLKHAFAMIPLEREKPALELVRARNDAANEAVFRLMAASAEASLFAEADSFRAVWELRLLLEQVDTAYHGRSYPLAALMELTGAIQDTSDRLAVEMRTGLKLSELPPLSSIKLPSAKEDG